MSVLPAPVAADLVVLAKFDMQAQVKLRAAYGLQGRTVALHPPSPSGHDGIERALQAHSVVSKHAPSLIPEVLAHGRLANGSHYLIEKWVDGPLLATRTRLADAGPEILTGLSHIHSGYGVSNIRLSKQWPQLVERWRVVTSTGIVSPGLAKWVADLIRRDCHLRRSWIHGDVVPTNVIQSVAGPTLIDWEYSQLAPIMVDGAKLHLFSDRPTETLYAVLTLFGSSSWSNCQQDVLNSFSPAEELALAHANFIAQFPIRRKRLAGHPQEEVYLAQIARQVGCLEQVHTGI